MKQKILLIGVLDSPAISAVNCLLNENYQVKIFVSFQNRATQKLEKLGAEIVVGDLSNFEDLHRELKQIDRVYYNHPLIPSLLENTRIFIRAAEANRIEAVINMGQWLAEFENQQSILTNQIKSASRLFQESALNTVHLIPGLSVKDIFITMEFIYYLGLIMLPLGEGKNPFVSNEDLGLVIAALLMNPFPYTNQKLRPTGPKSLSPKDMAKVFTKVMGRKVTYINVPEWIFLNVSFFYARELHITIFSLLNLRHYLKQFRKNQFAIGGPTDVVKKITGKEPDDFETIVRNQLADSSFEKRGFLTWFLSVKKLIAIQLMVTPKIKEFESFYK